MKTLIALVLAALCILSSGGRVWAQAPPVAAFQTRDTWRSVRTNHLFVIGNAEPEKLRQVATWLEYFHGTFARMVSRNVLDSAVPTTVIVFRNDASFLPFKPLYQGRPANVSGFFIPGQDVNYIAISLDPREENPYSTAFHEYVHLHVRENVPGAPVWLHEGLAELYGSLQFSGNEAVLGVPLHFYLQLLRSEELLPLKTLFSVGFNSPHYNEDDKTGIFYGQSWALVHYLMLSDQSRPEQFKKFLQQVGQGTEVPKAIEYAFGLTVSKLEEELQAYVRRGTLAAQRISGINPLASTSYTATQRSSLTDGEALYYLGDLLKHSGRRSDAERFFKQAIVLDPGFVPPYVALGELYVEQNRFAEAKKYLEKATASPQNHTVHYLYAYVLSREGVASNGEISGYSPENVAIMREQLLRSIKLAPTHAPSYYLLAVVDFVANERSDEALEMAQKAHQLAPGNQNYSSLVKQIEDERSAGNTARRARVPVTSAMIAQPAKTTSTARMLGGDMSGGTAIHDGQTIENPSSLPALDDILNKYVAAAGGAAAINAVTSRVVKGTVDVVGVSRGGTFETYTQAPNKAFTSLQANPMGIIKVSYNGSVGWAQTGSAVRTLKGAELASVQKDADFYAILDLKKIYPKLSLRGVSKIGYREVYVIELQPATGSPDRLFVDAESYLPVRMNSSKVQNGVAVPIEIYFDDWREVGGVKVPFIITESFGKVTLTFTVKEIRNNIPVDTKIFERPQ